MEINEKDKDLEYQEEAETSSQAEEAEADAEKEPREIEKDLTKDSGTDESVKETTEEETPTEENFNKKSFFKSKKIQIEEKDEEITRLNDKIIRKAAEFDNFRKRSEKEKSEMFEIGAKSVIEKVLPVVDSFERGLETVQEEDKDNDFVEGVEKIYKQLMSCLEEIDVKPVESLGKEFNPEFHNAVIHEEDPEQGENIIVDEFQKGYTYRGTVVRYSMVKVVN